MDARTIGLIIVLLLAFALIAFGMLREMKPARRQGYVAKWHQFKAWFKLNVQALIGIPFVLVGFWLSGVLLRWWQPESGVYDPGILQRIVVAIVSLVVGVSIARFGANLNIKWWAQEQNINPIDRQWLFAILLLAYCWLSAGL